MQSAEEYQIIIEDYLRKLNFPDHPKNLYEPLRYFLTLGGKRTRPSLTMMACNLFGEPGLKSIHAAIAIELFHNFTLIHDDIMDEAPLRRNSPTVHEKWNRDIAILSGDALFTIAFSTLAKNDVSILPDLISVFSQTALEVCEGQQMDMDFESASDIKIEDYIEMIRLKTSVLIGAALKMGAIVAEEKDEHNLQAIYDFGVNIGLSFQLQDDILDVYAGNEKFGKQSGGDILLNKKTFLLLKAYELANQETMEKLEFQYHNTNGAEKIEKVKSIFDKLGVKNAAEKQKEYYYQEALKNLESIKVEDKNKIALLEMAKTLMYREH